MEDRRCKPFVCFLTTLFLLMISFPLLVSGESKLPIIFNFGDSNSDTGGLVAAFGGSLPLPFGRVFFRRSTGRATDGRLVLDFLCEDVNTSYLNPYLEALGSNFTNGANFAINAAATATTPTLPVPFTLPIQVQQFLHFRSRSLELCSQGSRNAIDEEGFGKALYMLDIGQNDIFGAYEENFPYDQVVAKIPSFLFAIEDAIKIIYESGGRKFWVHNTGPLGCLPRVLSRFEHKSQDLDSYGCLASFNDASKAFNDGLSTSCDKLRSEMENITIIYNDVYAIKYDIVGNYSKYGFDQPFMACYGSGPITCPEGSRRISWDGTHYTEAANTIVASKLLTSSYSKPQVKFQSLFHRR